MQSLELCLWEEMPIESGHQPCFLGEREREARSRRLDHVVNIMQTYNFKHKFVFVKIILSNQSQLC